MQTHDCIRGYPFPLITLEPNNPMALPVMCWLTLRRIHDGISWDVYYTGPHSLLVLEGARRVALPCFPAPWAPSRAPVLTL